LFWITSDNPGGPILPLESLLFEEVLISPDAAVDAVEELERVLD